MRNDGPGDGGAFLDWLQESSLLEAAQGATTEADWEEILFRLETLGPYTAAAAECPFFVTTPPTLLPKSEWESVRDTRIDVNTWRRFTEKSFMPVDRQLFTRRALDDLLGVTGTAATHPLIDLDYGLVLTPGGRVRNFNLDLSLLRRLQEVDNYYVQFPAAVLSMGAFRARGLLGLKSKEPWVVPEIEVTERSQLEEVVSKLRAQIGSGKAELWFRGQNQDILIDGSLRTEPLCPWRHTQDSSLVPSLYRNAWHGTDIRPYAEKLLHVQRYVSFVERTLGIRLYTDGTLSTTARSKLPPEWDSYAIAFSSKTTDQDGNILSIRDYHHAFNGLQRSFFLQHYGLPSNILDITKDLDTALFFAQNKVDGEKRVVVSAEGDAVLYVFILLPGLDRFLDSSALSEHYGLLRPARQKCGLLCGASFINRNQYARYIGLKIRLRRHLQYDSRLTPQYLYPPRAEDSFLDALLTFREKHEAELGAIAPFAPRVVDH